MHIDTLKTYCDVVPLRSFSRGAETNNLLQAAASLTVQRLKKQIVNHAAPDSFGRNVWFGKTASASAVLSFSGFRRTVTVASGCHN